MKKTALWILIFALAAGGAYYIWQQNRQDAEPAVVEKQSLPLPEEPLEPAIKYPVPQPPVQIDTQVVVPSEAEEEEEPLPLLNDSDHAMEEEFTRLFSQALTDQPGLGKLFIFKKFIQRFVVTVDNMTATKLPRKYRLATPPPGSFSVNKNAPDQETIAPANYQRYTLYVNLVDAIDAKTLAAVYVRYYPLFQQAYEELGYPDQYFNDRLVEVVDHLLNTPDVREPVKLVRPSVYYKFADPELEALSAGQKILIRMGYDNESRIKAKLREIRRELTSLALDL